MCPLNLNILEQLIYIRAGEVSTVLVKEEQLDLLELLERLDPGVGEGNLEVEDKKGRKAPLTSCSPSLRI